MTAISLVAASAVAFGACSTSDGPEEPAHVAPGHVDGSSLNPSAGPLGPSSINGGVPQGWRHDLDGARAAAMSAVRLTGDVARSGFITRSDMISRLASVRFGPELAKRTDQQLADLSEALGDAQLIPPLVTWLEVPLTARVIGGNEDRATVQVWSVMVMSPPEDGVPRQVWRTIALDLVWEDEDWKVDGWDTLPGPTPALPPATSVATVGDVVEVAEWPAAADVAPGGPGKTETGR